jgi:CheY-like chemotaxis protein
MNVSESQDAQASLGASPEGGAAPSDMKRILLVDDEKTILRVFRLVLSGPLPECRIDLANNGAEAVDAFSAGHHGVLLMDLHMPVMDGQTAFMEIQKLCDARNWMMPSIAFCTGFAPPASLSRLIAQGQRHGLLLKPVRNDVLVEAIRSRLT